uniref:Uncharacterized protein n=1 Tax=Anguilla anguilla TaxID=7936 RepID=A0A0E9UGV5_ANGAN
MPVPRRVRNADLYAPGAAVSTISISKFKSSLPTELWPVDVHSGRALENK